MITITKADIAKKISSKLGLSINLSEEILSKIIESSIDLIVESEKLHIKNFGQFILSRKKSRPGQNISKKIEVIIPEKNVVRFSASRTFRNKLNKG